MANPHLTGHEFSCKQCGCSFRASPSRQQLFCSLRCYNDWITAPVEVRFFRHLSEPDERGCILWTSTKNHSGYGVLCIKASLNTRIFAHRLAWIIKHGDIPGDLYVLHRCDNPPCVNVDHLFLGTQQDNNRDKLLKGRHAKGEQCRRSHLTEDMVRAIRAARDSGESQYSIGRRFGIAQQTVHKIVSRQRWAHVN